jgi:hypothetical protein
MRVTPLIATRVLSYDEAEAKGEFSEETKNAVLMCRNICKTYGIAPATILVKKRPTLNESQQQFEFDPEVVEQLKKDILGYQLRIEALQAENERLRTSPGAHAKLDRDVKPKPKSHRVVLKLLSKPMVEVCQDGWRDVKTSTFFPNGTKLRTCVATAMHKDIAEVSNGLFVVKDRSFNSMSALAQWCKGGKSANGWTELMVLKPGRDTWVKAAGFRKSSNQ